MEIIKLKSQRSGLLAALLAVGSALTIPLGVSAQDKSAEIDRLLSFATNSTPGAVVAVSQHGKILYHKAVGLSDLEQLKAMELNSVFDIGSTRKQFVAAAILLLVEEKKLSLSDRIGKFFPKLPSYRTNITVDHLLTHTSGIRDWTGLQGLASDDPDAMKLIMRQDGLNFSPGEQWSYSNSGYVFLAEIVSKVSGITFAQFLSKRIFVPLGMKSTSYVVNLRGDLPNRAMAYKKEKGTFVKDMQLDNDRGGAGALFSTAGDLLIWNDALSADKLGKTVSKKLMELTRLNNGRQLNYGRGLVLEENLAWHSGGAAGYHTWIGRVIGQGISVAVLCNADQIAATALAERVLAIYAPGTGVSKVEDGPPPVLTGQALTDAKSFSGLFISDKGEILRLALDRDRFRVVGGPGLAEVTKGKFRRWGANVFYVSQDKFTLEFVSDSEIKLQTMEGKVINYKRAETYAPDAAALAEFAGRFESKEIGGNLTFSVGNSALLAIANGIVAEGINFKPILKDTFQFAGVVLRFVRDKDGKVVAMNYSNPVVGDVKFNRTTSK